MNRRRNDAQLRRLTVRATVVYILIGVILGLTVVALLDITRGALSEAYDLGYNDAMAGMYINPNSDLILQEFTVCE